MAFLLLLLLVIPPGTLIAGLSLMRHRTQRQQEQQRQAYVITFPTQVEAMQVVQWLRTISGTKRTLVDELLGSPTIVFEVWPDSTGITHRIKLPWQRAEHLILQLQSKVPGAHVVQEKLPPKHEWVRYRRARRERTG